MHAVLNADEVQKYSQMIAQIHIQDEILDYIAELIYNTRNNGDLFLGASPRASLSISRSAKAMAAIQGRDFVTPDDVRSVLKPA